MAGYTEHIRCRQARVRQLRLPPPTRHAQASAWSRRRRHVRHVLFMTMTNRDSAPLRPALSRFGVYASAEF
eukprot:2969877-Prymnesium_polylepis.1